MQNLHCLLCLVFFYHTQPLSGNTSKLLFFCFVFLLEEYPYQDIHLAGEGQDKNSVKRSYQVFLVGEGGGEEAVEGDAAGVGGEHGEQAEDPNPHPQSLQLILGLKQILCFVLVVVA